ncbi:MAG: MarR family transcriptional regulator [Nitrospirae bacterium]|nr:MarR family transcriptional regulator [Nitrospirota bacterium]
MKQLREGGFLIAKIHHLSGRILAKKIKEYKLKEINPAQGRILFALWQKDGISIQELSKKTSLEKSTLTSMLDRLEKTGYLTRIPSNEDRRKIIIGRTEKDKKLQEVYLQVSREMAELFYMGFTKKEIDEFEVLLGRILENLLSSEKSRI